MDKEKECSRHRGERETDREIKKIRELISDLATNSEVNKANLEHTSESYKELATANSLTHYKLFARTEALGVSLKELETKHGEHVKHGTQATTAKHNRYTMLVSWVAIGISLATTGVLVVQAVFMR